MRRSGLALLLVAAACSPRPVQPAYAVQTAFAVTRGRDGVDGRVELLQDARIRPAMHEAIREAYGDDPCSADPPPVLRDLCPPRGRRPLLPARLRLVDASGRVVESRAFERPLAELSVAHLYADARPTYLATVDLSAGFGSYSGPLTRPVEVRDGRLRWLTALDARTQRDDSLFLVLTLKTGWRLIPRAAGGRDILQAACRPDFDAPSSASVEQRFIITFEHYTFDGRRWVKRSRSERGFWEYEDTFPSRDRFP
jgi:hypothetical protein